MEKRTNYLPLIMFILLASIGISLAFEYALKKIDHQLHSMQLHMDSINTELLHDTAADLFRNSDTPKLSSTLITSVDSRPGRISSEEYNKYADRRDSLQRLKQHRRNYPDRVDSQFWYTSKPTVRTNLQDSITWSSSHYIYAPMPRTVYSYYTNRPDKWNDDFIYMKKMGVIISCCDLRSGSPRDSISQVYNPYWYIGKDGLYADSAAAFKYLERPILKVPACVVTCIKSGVLDSLRIIYGQH